MRALTFYKATMKLKKHIIRLAIPYYFAKAYKLPYRYNAYVYDFILNKAQPGKRDVGYFDLGLKRRMKFYLSRFFKIAPRRLLFSSVFFYKEWKYLVYPGLPLQEVCKITNSEHNKFSYFEYFPINYFNSIFILKLGFASKLSFVLQNLSFAHNIINNYKPIDRTALYFIDIHISLVAIKRIRDVKRFTVFHLAINNKEEFHIVSELNNSSFLVDSLDFVNTKSNQIYLTNIYMDKKLLSLSQEKSLDNFFLNAIIPLYYNSNFYLIIINYLFCKWIFFVKQILQFNLLLRNILIYFKYFLEFNYFLKKIIAFKFLLFEFFYNFFEKNSFTKFTYYFLKKIIKFLYKKFLLYNHQVCEVNIYGCNPVYLSNKSYHFKKVFLQFYHRKFKFKNTKSPHNYVHIRKKQMLSRRYNKSSCFVSFLGLNKKKNYIIIF